MPDAKKLEKQFFNALRDIFVGDKVEGESGKALAGPNTNTRLPAIASFLRETGSLKCSATRGWK